MHAAIGAALLFSEVRDWQDDVRNLVVLAAPDEVAITALHASELPHFTMWEPDVNDQLTAIAFAPGPGVRELVSSLSLLGKEVVPV